MTGWRDGSGTSRRLPRRWCRAAEARGRWFASGLWLALVACGLLPSALAAQPTGVRLDFGVLVARPALDATSAAVFAGVGPGGFRASLGSTLGIGYDGRRYGATAVVDLAGVDIGSPVTRDGIDMGRQAALLTTVGLLGHWRPARRRDGWRPVFSVGYVRQRIGEVLVPADSLPAYARELRGDPSDTTARPTGVGGSGVRLGVALERRVADRDLPGRLVLRVEGAADVVTFARVTYDGRSRPLPATGTGLTPRLSLTLGWSPRARAVP